MDDKLGFSKPRRYAITNCDEYLAAVYTECCVEGCGEGVASGAERGTVNHVVNLIRLASLAPQWLWAR